MTDGTPTDSPLAQLIERVHELQDRDQDDAANDTDAMNTTDAEGGEDASGSGATPPTRRVRARRWKGSGQWIVVVALFVVLGLGGVVIAVLTKPETAAKPGAVKVGAPVRGPNTSIFDRFDRGNSTSSMSKAETGQDWSVVGAPYGIDGNTAYITAADKARRAIAVIGMGTGDGSVQVTMTKIAAGAGIVFRYHDAFNYWALTAAPKFGTWNLQKVIDGNITNVGNVGLAGGADGTTVRVRFTGGHIAIDVDGVEKKAFDDATLQTDRLAGIIGVADDLRVARWDNFIANIAAKVPAPGASSDPSLSSSSSKVN